MSDLRVGAERVVSRLRGAGYEAYFAGGCVRDQLLGLEPKDYDIVTNATPDEVVQLFTQAIEVGVAFGVVRVRLGRGLEYEVATYREDGAYSDGRRPDAVRYADSAERDVERRDFTVNALLYDPVEDRVLDWVGGQGDLKAGVVRAVGEPNARFSEDRLRMLRAVRFAARLGFEIEARTRQAIAAQAKELRAVSVERIVHELDGIFLSPRPGLGLSLLEQTGLLPFVFPASVQWSGEVRARWAERLERLCRADLTLAQRLDVAWAAAMDGGLDADLEPALREFKHSRARIRGVSQVRNVTRQIAEAGRSTQAAVMHVAAGPDAHAWVEVLRVWEGEKGAAVKRLIQAVEDVALRPLPPRPVLTGAGLRGLGLSPGPEFKRILAAVDDAVLERRVSDREGALQLASRLASQG